MNRLLEYLLFWCYSEHVSQSERASSCNIIGEFKRETNGVLAVMSTFSMTDFEGACTVCRKKMNALKERKVSRCSPWRRGHTARSLTTELALYYSSRPRELLRAASLTPPAAWRLIGRRKKLRSICQIRPFLITGDCIIRIMTCKIWHRFVAVWPATEYLVAMWLNCFLNLSPILQALAATIQTTTNVI